MSETKERLLRAGEQLFRTQGYSGTGLKQLAKEARAPWSSMYHFFPRGKEQLAGEVVRYAAGLYAEMIDRAFAAFRDPVDAVAAIFKAEAKMLEASGYKNGCPVASVALDISSTVEKIRKPCAEAFALWIDAYARGIAKSGVEQEAAGELAGYVLAALEGAIVLSRTAKSAKPVERTGRLVCQTLKAQLPRMASA